MAVEKKESDSRNTKFHNDVKKIVEEEAKQLDVDPSVFNFDMSKIGDTNNFGTIVSNSGKALKIGGILERPPELYAGFMNYKQFRGVGERKVLMYSQPIPISEFISKINQPDAGEVLGLTSEQVEDYRKLINAADKSYTK